MSVSLIQRYACVLTHNRPELLQQCVAALNEQMMDEDIIILDNASDPPVNISVFNDWPNNVIDVIRIPLQPPNLAYNMNIGFKRAQELAQQDSFEKWDVAMICDDVIIPPGWFDAVATCMREQGAVAASTHTIREVSNPILKTAPDPDIINRMQGSAFVLAGEAGIRADENLHWWFQDTDLDWQARKAGGMAIAPGPVAINSRPNDFTYSVPGLGEQAGRDRQAFTQKWGWVPW